ncbi:hypothetical protein QWJ34_02770 [Saccharibacillus sp. CPCC 101409]|uniref:hypothetical protein n=1 Tax=Saccharibacillus sp. CPCC 101409 TaxID=3058041 RepID=UPI00267174AB|nr:hypothetical protein [Saccharibacillus sp. CPCC 101409]MDO3408682.1 hypothetical protein [Saccharibacillus sp. CPCC 101409]
MKNFLKSKSFLIPTVLVFFLGLTEIAKHPGIAGFLSILTSSLVAALIAGAIIGGIIYLTLALNGGKRRK